MRTLTDRRRAVLVAALGFALIDPRRAPDAPALATVRAWLGSWTGIGLVTSGMARHGYDLQLTRYDEQGWRATFYVTGLEHSATAATASAWQPTPWRAVQAAAWQTLRATGP